MVEIFEEFDSFDDFIKQTKISIKFLEGIEGPLVNNKELYKVFLENPITLNDYHELRNPLPLAHETLYSLYSIRLQKLGYIPLYQTLWNEQLQTLSHHPHP
ncbi:uncharacterized protein LOC112604370 [Melanaphis sacchari]|uniref:uncharacterized protein LOC112604370 n=1 Tax=Melanaphis sacchari TaxID=742174 RepID=UPI000DC140AE|nr:uncharacterized protein LOC112604370 [Melanaphis sacchari]